MVGVSLMTALTQSSLIEHVFLGCHLADREPITCEQPASKWLGGGTGLPQSWIFLWADCKSRRLRERREWPAPMRVGRGQKSCPGQSDGSPHPRRKMSRGFGAPGQDGQSWGAAPVITVGR